MDILRAPTPDRWLPIALADFDSVLRDHAHCERKAAASALSLITAFPELDDLVHKLGKLAQEELRHFAAVHRLLRGRGLSLQRDGGDPYAQRLAALVRSGSPSMRRTDRLLVCALIEARSAERLQLLAGALRKRDPELAEFYAQLAHAEAGHHRLFVDLARTYDERHEADARLEALAEAEAAIMHALPLEPRIH